MIHLNEELQAYLFSLLSGDLQLKSLGVKGVFDKVPDNSSYPYIRFEEIMSDNFDTHSDTGFQGELTIKVFDRSDSSLTTKRIQSRIYTLLHDADFNMTNFKNINFKCKLTVDTVENDSRTQNGTQKFDFIFARK